MRRHSQESTGAVPLIGIRENGLESDSSAQEALYPRKESRPGPLLGAGHG